MQERIRHLQAEVQTLIVAAQRIVTSHIDGKTRFHLTHAAPRPLLDARERAQTLSFVIRYEHLPKRTDIEVVIRDGKHLLAEYGYYRHVLNDYRPLIQNHRDSTFYRRVHSTWRTRLLRVNPADGMTSRVEHESGSDVTPQFAAFLDQSNSAIGHVLRGLEFDYLYNGILQHSGPEYSERFVTDYVSGDLNYIVLKHVLVLDLIHDLLEPYYHLFKALASPRMGGL